MLCDLTGGQIPAHDGLEQMANNLVHDDQPMRRDPEKEPFVHRTSQL